MQAQPRGLQAAPLHRATFQAETLGHEQLLAPAATVSLEGRAGIRLLCRRRPLFVDNGTA